MDYNEFAAKEKQLFAALKRVKQILKEHSEGKRSPDDWNKTHDLQYRIESRIWQNQSNYYDWHFKTYQFNSYSIC